MCATYKIWQWKSVTFKISKVDWTVMSELGLEHPQKTDRTNSIIYVAWTGQVSTWSSGDEWWWNAIRIEALRQMKQLLHDIRKCQFNYLHMMGASESLQLILKSTLFKKALMEANTCIITCMCTSCSIFWSFWWTTNCSSFSMKWTYSPWSYSISCE